MPNPIGYTAKRSDGTRTDTLTTIILPVPVSPPVGDYTTISQTHGALSQPTYGTDSP